MKEERGRKEVWSHAEETGMQEFIKSVSAHFPISDIAIFSPGRLTYLDQRPVKYTRIRPFDHDTEIDNSTGKIRRKSR